MKMGLPLKDLCSKIGSGVTPRGGADVYQESGTALIRSQNVYNGEFDESGLAHIDDGMAESMFGVTVKENDVLLNITGDSVARCCLAPTEKLPARVNQHVAIIRAKRGLLNPEFLMYYLISPQMQAKMLSISGSGGTRKALTKQMIEKFEVPVINFSTQNHIASILAAYGDLIEINNRRIQLLEDAARQVYQEWFVRLRFPEHEKTPMHDALPDGWERVKLKDVCEAIDYGFTASASQEPIGPKFLRITDIVPTTISWSDVLK